MIRFEHQMLFKFAAISLLMSSVVGCGTPPTPNTPKPSASASATPTPTPTPLPSSEIVLPTPEPSVSPSTGPTPFPTGTPYPTFTPYPSASPTVTPVPSGSPGAEVSTRFRAAVINSNRQVVPVVSTEFMVYPYEINRIKRELSQKNNVEAMPAAPQQSSSKYTYSEKVCSSTGCVEEEKTDLEAYNRDLSNYRQNVLPEWESRAYRGLQTELDRVAQGRVPTRLTTDQNGEATLNLTSGLWYFNGKYTYSNSTVLWEDIPFNITSTTRTIDLIR